jgi:anthranilate phosphoribosyltransferase
MLSQYIKQLLCKKNLSATDIESAFKAIITGNNEAQIAAFLTLLRAKGETADEITALVKTMQSMMLVCNTNYHVLDIVGTGGDGFNTVNISTGAALLAASCGVKIAKHGNRSVSSMSGSADVLEHLGININISPSEISACIDSTNFGFFYAPNFHPILGRLKLIRKNLALPTVFNLVGPLLNPAQAKFLMIGVADLSYLNIISDVLLQLGVERALVFHCSGLDEICCVGPINMIEINQSNVHQTLFDPIDYGFNQCTIESLQGGSAEKNADIIKYSLKGNPGAISDTLILNAGLANYIYGLCDSIEDGFALAKDAHAKGSAYQLLEKLIARTKPMPTFSETHHA